MCMSLTRRHLTWPLCFAEESALKAETEKILVQKTSAFEECHGFRNVLMPSKTNGASLNVFFF